MRESSHARKHSRKHSCNHTCMHAHVRCVCLRTCARAHIRRGICLCRFTFVSMWMGGAWTCVCIYVYLSLLLCKFCPSPHWSAISSNLQFYIDITQSLKVEYRPSKFVMYILNYFYPLQALYLSIIQSQICQCLIYIVKSDRGDRVCVCRLVLGVDFVLCEGSNNYMYI